MSKRSKRVLGAKIRNGVERLESRELLTLLLDGLAGGDLTGSTVVPLGNIFDDTSAGLVGDDFAISAPEARTGAGDVYVVFGSFGLDPQFIGRGCINTPIRVQGCGLISSLLNIKLALVIRGAAAGDLTGFSVAGVGDVIGDSRPDVLIGAPLAKGTGTDPTGRAYLIGGDYIASVIGTARSQGGIAVATIDLANPSATGTLRTFNGRGPGDQAGNSVAGLGTGFFAVSAPRFGVNPKQERGAVYVFAPLRGQTGPATLAPISTILGPSLNAHLGGLPVEEFTTNGFKGSGLSGIKNPGLIAPSDEQPNDRRYNLIGGFEPDLLIGAPDACVDSACTTAAAPRNGMAYLLAGRRVFTGTGAGSSFDLSTDADLKTLEAIVVQGAANGDRLGATVSSAGDLDGDLDVDNDGDGRPDGKSDIMIAAVNRDVPGRTAGGTLNNAGEVYVVFGREVNGVPFADGQCQGDPGSTSGPQKNFRQCRDATGRVVPLSAGNFLVPGTLVGLTLRGDGEDDRTGMALAEAGNFLDTAGQQGFSQPNQVGVSDILIGAPFHDLVNPTTGAVTPSVGRAYAMFGSRDYRGISGVVRSLGLITSTDTGAFFDGRTANDNYGISVAGVGNAQDFPRTNGDDVVIGGNHVDVTLAGAATPDVGEIELFFGSVQAPSGGGVVVVVPGLPTAEPGPFGPQLLTPGYWSFTNRTPPAGSVVRFPLVPSLVGPFVPSFPLAAALFVPDRPTSGSHGVPSPPPPRFIYAVDSEGHLIQYRKSGKRWRAQDLTALSGGPAIRSDLRGQILASGARGVTELVVPDANNHSIRFSLGRNRKWTFQDLGVTTVASRLEVLTELGVQSR